GVPEGGARMMRPFLAAMTLSVLELTAHGFDPARGVDSVVVQRARAAGHRVVELESLSMQVALFADLSPATQTALLDATLRGLDDRSMLRDARQLHDAWRDGDAAALTATLADEWARMPADAARELQQRLVDARNDRMLARVTALHAAGAGDVLVAIGAAHLVGDTGLVEQLRRRGWRVTQR
nr:TraB/GumN family protein [Burkholderiales bacterium]